MVNTDNLPIVNLDSSVIKINEDYCDTCSGDKLEKVSNSSCMEQDIPTNITCFTKFKKDSYIFLSKLKNKVANCTKKCCQKLSFTKKSNIINLKEFEDTSIDELSDSSNIVKL
jgi:hypothetical protein